MCPLAILIFLLGAWNPTAKPSERSVFLRVCERLALRADLRGGQACVFKAFVYIFALKFANLHACAIQQEAVERWAGIPEIPVPLTPLQRADQNTTWKVVKKRPTQYLMWGVTETKKKKSDVQQSSLGQSVCIAGQVPPLRGGLFSRKPLNRKRGNTTSGLKS